MPWLAGVADGHVNGSADAGRVRHRTARNDESVREKGAIGKVELM
jgi:hypothetical protein